MPRKCSPSCSASSAPLRVTSHLPAKLLQQDSGSDGASLAPLWAMNPHNFIADSNGSADLGPKITANQLDSSSSVGAPPAEPSSAGAVQHRDESGESNKRLIIERVASDPGKTWPLTLDQIIKQTLVRLLSETAGNRRRTASLLGISRSTLYRMLARYGIDHVGRDGTSRGTSRKVRGEPPVPPA
jgi:transcriptional regulator of acetoin/glycerol metabolism